MNNPLPARVRRATHTLTSVCAGMLAMLALAPAALAAGTEPEPYTAQRLADLQAQDRAVLVDVYADWCPTCRTQGQVLGELRDDPALAHIVTLKLDWDDQRKDARALGATRQSTLVLFDGAELVGRSVAQTDPEVLRAFLAPVAGSASADTP